MKHTDNCTYQMIIVKQTSLFHSKEILCCPVCGYVVDPWLGIGGRIATK